MSQHKVFLCHNSKDKPEVRQIRDQLRRQDIETWMDEKNITGFDDWKKKIKENISQINAVAVFLGSSGFGEWQKFEIISTEEEISRRQNKTLFTLKQQTTLRAGLVILPSCQQTFQEIQKQYYGTPYGWLFKYHTVDLRTLADPIEELIIALTGQARNSNVDVDSLLSERGVNYTRLRNFLRAGQWKEADQETLAVMLKTAGREKEGWLCAESIENFPCTDLRTINQLWVKNSGGRFGFSVQKRIWESVEKDYGKFVVRVGWRKGMFGWLHYEDPTFDINAPQGHLPVLVQWWVEPKKKDVDNDLLRVVGQVVGQGVGRGIRKSSAEFLFARFPAVMYWLVPFLVVASLVGLPVLEWYERWRRVVGVESLLSRPDL